MPARSGSQQRLFGMVHAYQQGKLKRAPAKIRQVAARISPEDAKDFAATSHENLPDRKKEARQQIAVLLVKRAAQTPQPAAQLVKVARRFLAGEPLIPALQSEFPAASLVTCQRAAAQLMSHCTR